MQIHYNRTMANFMSYLLITYFGSASKLFWCILYNALLELKQYYSNFINNRLCVTTAFFIEQIGNMYNVDYNINIYKYCVYCIDIIWRL